MAIWFRMSILAILVVLLNAAQAIADEREFRLSAPVEITESGLLSYVLPRFSLKTQVRITVVEPDAEADVFIGEEGVAVFDGMGRTWRMKLHTPEHKGVERFASWIRSDIGKRTITAFAIGEEHPFGLPELQTVELAAVERNGDPVVGQAVSQRMCARCHVVTSSDRMNAIGSTPSFFALRTLPDWEQRFEAFYGLNPHPAFTQVDGVTPPFPDNRPPPIVPLEMTLGDIEAMLAYVAGLDPADLGAPLAHQ